MLAARPLNTLSWKENLKIESTQQAVFVDVKTFSFSVMVVLGLLVQSDFQNLRQHFFKKNIKANIHIFTQILMAA